MVTTRFKSRQVLASQSLSRFRHQVCVDLEANPENGSKATLKRARLPVAGYQPSDGA